MKKLNFSALLCTGLTLTVPYALAVAAPTFAQAAAEQKHDMMTTAGKVADSPENAKPLAVKSVAPPVALRTVEGKRFALGDALKKQPTVLIFYRGGWCPFCNKQLADMHKIEGDLKDLGYQIIAVSMDRPEELRKTLDKNELTYTLLSDSEAKAVKAFGVAYKLDDATVEKYKGYHLDLEEVSGQKHHILPVPSVFLIGTDRVIRYVYSNADYKVRLSSEEVLAKAKAIHDGTEMSEEKK